MTTVSREVSDLGYTFTVDCPEGWREFELPGSLLTLGGHLDEPEGSLLPTVQVRITPATDAVSGFGELRAGLSALPEVQLLGESGDVESDPPYYSLGAAYVNPETRGTETQVVVSIFVPASPSLVTAIGICGGGAPEAVVEQLLAMVQTLRVSRPAA